MFEIKRDEQRSCALDRKRRKGWVKRGRERNRKRIRSIEESQERERERERRVADLTTSKQKTAF